VGPRLATPRCVVAAGTIGTGLAVALGASQRCGAIAHSITASRRVLIVTALPEFLVAITLVIVFATGGVPHPARVSFIPARTYPGAAQDVGAACATSVIVIVPYIAV